MKKRTDFEGLANSLDAIGDRFKTQALHLRGGEKMMVEVTMENMRNAEDIPEICYFADAMMSMAIVAHDLKNDIDDERLYMLLTTNMHNRMFDIIKLIIGD